MALGDDWIPKTDREMYEAAQESRKLQDEFMYGRKKLKESQRWKPQTGEIRATKQVKDRVRYHKKSKVPKLHKFGTVKDELTMIRTNKFKKILW